LPPYPQNSLELSTFGHYRDVREVPKFKSKLLGEGVHQGEGSVWREVFVVGPAEASK